MRKKKIPIFNLDPEEKELSDSFDRQEWIRVDNFEEEQEKAHKAAVNYFGKNARINIRLSQSDLDHIKKIAAFEGLPYQTLIASILHKYAAGHLYFER